MEKSETRDDALVSWKFIENQGFGLLPWAAVEDGLRRKYCGTGVAVGNAERWMVGRDDPRFVDIAIARDEIEMRPLVREIALRWPSESREFSTRIWTYLVVAWVAAGHEEPGEYPAEENATLAERLESAWVQVGMPNHLSFLAPWMPVDEADSGSRNVPAEALLARWLEAERPALVSAASATAE